MNTLVRKPLTRWLAIAVVAVIGTGLALFFLNRPGPEIPAVDLASMEPKVRTQLNFYRKAVTADPDSATAWSNLAQAFHAHDLFPQAVAAYAEAIAFQPGDYRWPYLAALAQAETSPQAALPLFRQAISLQPANAAVYINYGDVLLRLGQHAEAAQAYRQALALDSGSSYALYGLAQVALIDGEPGEATELLERAQAIAPHHGEIYSLLAQAYQRLGMEDQARRQAMLAGAWPDASRASDPVAQAMESLAVDSQATARRGVSLAKRGAFEGAEKAFREVLEIRPGNARDFANLGGALAGQGRQKEALEAYRKGLEIDPSDVDTLNNIGLTFLQLGDFDRAGQYLGKALELDPGFAAALGNLGLLAEQQKRPDQAVEYFRQALELNPGLLFARNALASRLALEGDIAGAVEQWRLVLEINPDELATIYNLARTLAASGEHAEAIRLLRHGLELAPNSSRLIAALAWELATAPAENLRNGAEALQMTRRLVSAYPNQPEMLDVVAAALAETGDFTNAVKVMERAVKLAGGNAQALALRLNTYRLGRPWRQPQVPAIKVSASPLDR